MSEEPVEQKPSVLLSFRAENARSFRDEFEFSMLATAMAEKRYVREVEWREGGSPIRVLPVAGVYGANASGKSNLLNVMHDMRSFVLSSFKFGNPGGGVSRSRFLLDETAREQPSRYEVEIVLHGVRHIYGFELDAERVTEEWAYHYPKGRAALLFHREGDSVRPGASERSRARALEDLLRPNALYLSTAAATNHPALLPLYLWFQRNMWLAAEDSRPDRQVLTTNMLDDERYRQAVLGLLRAADLGIVDVQKYKLDPIMQERVNRIIRILTGTEGEPEDESIPSIGELEGVELVHRGANGDYVVPPDDESLGTMVWFGLVGPLLQSLESGSILLVDELDASLHTDLVEQVIRLYQDPETNPNRAQLVFNTHDSVLLGDATGERLLGRDQVWLTEKFNDGRTRVHSLFDFNPRKQEAVGKRYMNGWYGAKPILIPGEFDSAVELVTAGKS